MALLPMDIKGFGHIKEKSMQEASQKRDEIITVLGVGPITHLHAAE